MSDPHEKHIDEDGPFSTVEETALAAWPAARATAGFAERVARQARHAADEAPRRTSGSSSGTRARIRSPLRAAMRFAIVAMLLSGVGGAVIGVASPDGSSSMPIYVACLAFGGVLLLASLVGGLGEGSEADGGGDGGDVSHDVPSHAHDGTGHEAGHTGLLPFLSMRFWVFALTFFGLTGVVLNGLDLASPGVTPFVSGAVGIASGYAAARIFQALASDTVGRLEGEASHIGREGKLLLPTSKAQRGKVRLSSHGSQVDMIAETDGDEALPAGTSVLIVGIRGNVAVVDRSPAPTTPDTKESP